MIGAVGAVPVRKGRLESPQIAMHDRPRAVTKNNKEGLQGHMEMEPMICRPFTLCLALLGLLSLPFAAGTADDLLALHQMRLATQKS